MSVLVLLKVIRKDSQAILALQVFDSIWLQISWTCTEEGEKIDPL